MVVSRMLRIRVGPNPPPRVVALPPVDDEARARPTTRRDKLIALSLGVWIARTTFSVDVRKNSDPEECERGLKTKNRSSESSPAGDP